MLNANHRGSRRSAAWWSCALIGVAMLAGCASLFQEPAVGVWELSNVDEISAQSTTLHLGVVRLECSGGKTGTILEPEVSYEKERIVIRTDVEPLQEEGAYTCLGNDTVPLTVELSEPVGQRELVDAACLKGRAVTTIFCTDDGVRWSPQQNE